MFNFVYQLDWAAGCPGTWSNISLGIFVRVFVDKFNIEIDRLIEPIALPAVGGPHLIRWKLEWIE